MKTPVVSPRRSKKERDELIDQYLPLVRYVVSRLPVAMPATLSREDFFSVGVIGLMHAASTYDPNRGASFKTFAFTAIRGAILDEIRKHDPVPRSRRDRLRKLDRATTELYNQLQRLPTLEELAAHMDVKASDLDEDLLALHTCRTLSLNDSSAGSGEEGYGLIGNLVSNEWDGPDEETAKREQVEDLTKAISELPETDRNVIVLYHYENLYLKEIGEILGVSESRISQILSRATARLQLKMKGLED